MEALNNLIVRLNKQEIAIVRAYVEHLNAKEKSENITLRLFDYLIKKAGQDPDVHACAQFLYGKNSDAKFRMIKKKLRSKILDALVTDKNIELNTGFDQVDISTLRLRKKVMSLNYIIHSKGSIPITNEIIEEVLAKGKKFENYPMMIDVLRVKKFINGFATGIKEFNEINKQIAFYEYCEQAKNKSVDYYYKLITRTDFQAALDKKTVQKYLQEAILDLQKDLKYTGSGLVGYYLKTIERIYFQDLGDHLSSRRASVEVLNYIRKHPSVFRRSRIGIAFDNIGKSDIFIGDYEKAISNFKAAQKIFLKDSKNFLVSKELELRALIYAEEIIPAEKVLKEIVDHPDINILGNFRQSKFAYYKANIQFLKGKYKEALKEISQYLEISKDKIGWDISVRVLAIMCQIELNNTDQATTMIDTLIQHVKRNRSVENDISERDAKIVQVLNLLSKNGFMFNTLNDKAMSAFVAISGNGKKYDWQPLGAELIPFHVWMGGKLRFKVKVKGELSKGNLQLSSK